MFQLHGLPGSTSARALWTDKEDEPRGGLSCYKIHSSSLKGMYFHWLCDTNLLIWIHVSHTVILVFFPLLPNNSTLGCQINVAVKGGKSVKFNNSIVPNNSMGGDKLFKTNNSTV